MFRSVAARSEFVAVVFATTADYWSRLVGYSMLGAGKFENLASLFACSERLSVNSGRRSVLPAD